LTKNRKIEVNKIAFENDRQTHTIINVGDRIASMFAIVSFSWHSAPSLLGDVTRSQWLVSVGMVSVGEGYDDCHTQALVMRHSHIYS
jgi:hypothetical protein